MSKLGIVLGGGGAKGSFQVGVLDYLLHFKKLNFSVIAGVSVGALNATLLAQGDYDTLEKIWYSLKGNSDIYKKKWGVLGLLFGGKSLYDFTPLKKMIDKYVDPQKIINTGKVLKIGAVSLETGEYHNGKPTDSMFKGMVYASTLMPFFAEPIDLEANRLKMVDGGLKEIAPVGEIINEGCDEIYVVLCGPRKLKPEKPTSFKDYILRTLGIILNDNIVNDLEWAESVNNWSDSALAEHGYKKIRFTVIEPKQDLPQDTLDFDPEKIKYSAILGFKTARDLIP